jgi:hypothetical protein
MEQILFFMLGMMAGAGFMYGSIMLYLFYDFKNKER